MRAHRSAKGGHKRTSAAKPPPQPDVDLSPVAGIAALRRLLAARSDPTAANSGAALEELLAKLEVDYRRVSRTNETPPVPAAPPVKRKAPVSLRRRPKTAPRVTAALLRLAEISRDDVVYDLGCGSGEMLIDLARRAGARAVGLDSRAEAIEQARKGATRVRGPHRVRFAVAPDLTEVEIHHASVVVLEHPDVDPVALRRHLLDSLPPGARIVSATLNMPEWPPARVVEIDGRVARCWIVPPRR